MVPVVPPDAETLATLRVVARAGGWRNRTPTMTAEQRGKRVTEGGIGQDDDIVSGLKFGLGPHRHQAACADHDAHPDIAGMIAEFLDGPSLDRRSGGDGEPVHPVGFVAEPDTDRPGLRVDSAHGRCNSLATAGTELPCTRTENATTTTTMP
jgi:hypothetical protein